MRLLEYEAKQLLRESGLPVPLSTVIHKGQPLPEVQMPCVLKSQVPIGGRGKAGGVVVVEDEDQLTDTTQKLFTLSIKGYTPHALLAESKLSLASEHYISLLIDRESSSIQLMAHADGGVEVENNTDGFFTSLITPGTMTEISDTVAKLFGEIEVTKIKNLITNLYNCFVANDATLLEVNPLVKTIDDHYVCADAKMELDDAASFRHEWSFEDKSAEVNFVTLNPKGNVATIANGAGLAMATVDAVASHGMRPANFLDVGGGANTNSVLAAFTRIMEYQNVQAIVINIFAGITRCDEVARAIIAARDQINNLPPLFIRLAGTNYAEAAELLATKNIPTLPTLETCIEAAFQKVAQ